MYWYCTATVSTGTSVPGQLGVPVVDVELLVPAAQLLDDLAQHQQGFVDVPALLQPEITIVGNKLESIIGKARLWADYSDLVFHLLM